VVQELAHGDERHGWYPVKSMGAAQFRNRLVTCHFSQLGFPGSAQSRCGSR
jgi:hypothetical protein